MIPSFSFKLVTRLAPLALLSSLSCGDGANDDKMSVAEFCKEWGRASCNKRVVESCAAENKDVCIESQAEWCETELVPKSKFSPDGAEECLEAVRDAYDNGSLTGAERDIVMYLSDPCDKILTGDGAKGATCTANDDCDVEEGLSCVLRLQESGTPTGRCHVPKLSVAGGDCSEPSAVCPDGTYCDDGNCLVKSSKDCSNVRPCQDGLVCTDGECVDLLATGKACKRDEQCATGICAEASNGKICAPNIPLDFSKEICEDFRPPLTAAEQQAAEDKAADAADDDAADDDAADDDADDDDADDDAADDDAADDDAADDDAADDDAADDDADDDDADDDATDDDAADDDAADDDADDDDADDDDADDDDADDDAADDAGAKK